MSTNRASKAELIKRREEIQQLILSGMNSVNIQEAMSQKYNTSKRAIAEDMRSIAQDWENRAEETNQLMRNKYLDRLEMLFNTAMEQGHVKTALEIQKEINKLNSLYREKDTGEQELPKFVNISKRGALKVVGDDAE